MPPEFPLLEGCCVSCSGFEAKDKEAVHRRVERLGGTASPQLTSLVTHVVVRDGLASDKYRVAARLGIPAVSVEFLDECERAARRLQQQQQQQQPLDCRAADAARAIEQVVRQAWYQPFSGCQICTTGFDHEVREEIKALVTQATPRDGCGAARVFPRLVAGCRPSDFDAMPERVGGGGSYHGVLTPACTHLIARSPTGQKYKFARQWGVRVVTFAWLMESLRTGYRQDEAEFAFAAAARDPRKASSAGVAREPGSGSGSGSDGASLGSPRASAPALSRLALGSAASAGGPDQAAAAQREALWSSPPQRRLLIQRSMAAGGSGARALPPQPRYPPSVQADRPHHDGGGSLVGRPLQSCSVVASEPDPFMESTSPRKRGGPPDTGGSGGGGARKHQRLAPEAQAPRSSGPRRSYAVVELFSSSPPLLELSARSPEHQSGRPEDILTEDAPPVSVSPAQPAACGGLADAGDGQLFEWCMFTSLGFTEGKQAILARTVRENGGVYSDLRRYHPEPEPDPDPAPQRGRQCAHDAWVQQALDLFVQAAERRQAVGAYVVVPLAGLRQQRQCEDAAGRSQRAHVVTECWIEQCLQEGMRYPDYAAIEAQGMACRGLDRGQHVLFRPLSVGPVRGAGAMSLSISGYEGLERDHIGRLAAALGIPFSETFSRSDTHLICRRPHQGKKYERAVKRGVSVTDAAWLYRLAATGVADECGAAEPAAATPAARAAAAALDTPGRTPIGVSLDRSLERAASNSSNQARETMPGTPTQHAYRRCAVGHGSEYDDATQLSPAAAAAAGAGGGGPAPVLEGVVVALSARLNYRRKELTELALQLGCRVLARFDASQATHLVHQSTRAREPPGGSHDAVVVSPWWLHACQAAQARVPEADYPCTFHPERRLRLVATPAAGAQPPQAVQRADGSDRGDRSAEGPAPRRPATTIDGIFGERAPHTQRRYRQTTAAAESDLGGADPAPAAAPAAAAPGAQPSPPAAHGTRIVYEDADALSERDQLILFFAK
ncbi:protein kinase activating protein dpb11 [Coemansia javaensis]|uniref:Protein kinase activating protein dpb11 n=1 Tax=Coemansia javaensis TaxID=2761396 RepID=A0A9W8HL37_9FUNG|nr:protein kinase activating protein dpb11 [Coemansia javaensis]